MKVYVWIKHKDHPDKTGAGMQQGDIAYIYPMVKDQGKLTQTCYFPVVMDLNIPCGSDFDIKNGEKQWDCQRCINNDPALCDVRKYMMAEWTAGTLFEEPKVKKVRRYNVDLDEILSSSAKLLVCKQDKTLAEEDKVIKDAEKNEVLKDKIKEKV